MKRIMIFLLERYKKYISPLLGNHCRFVPSCSDYMKLSITHHGVIVGLYKGIIRLLKCHPFHPGGYDPVSLDDGCWENKR